MLDIYQLDPEDAKSVEWTGDPEEYDLNLCNLGPSDVPFIVVNPWVSDSKPFYYIEEIPNPDRCVVFNYKNEWIAKYFPPEWQPEQGYETVEIELPKYVWRKNFDLDRTMTFVNDPMHNFEPDPWESSYELIWYIDPKFNPLEDKVWAMSCKPIGRPVKGTKDMGYISPDVLVEFNEHLPDLNLDIDSMYPAFFDLAHDCVYQLDPAHTPDETMWVVKFSPAYRKPKEWKWYGVITPQLTVKYNPALPRMDYDLDYNIVWHDLAYEHVWNLDRSHLKNDEDDIWAFKIKAVKKTKGVKKIGYVSPSLKFEVNAELPDINYNFDYHIPYYDLKYEHVWMLDQQHCEGKEIWAMRVSATSDPDGVKSMGEISPKLTVKYNPNLPRLDYDIDFNIPYYDLKYEHVWMLDPCHTEDAPEPMWAVKIKVQDKVLGTKVVGNVSPKFKMKTNPDIKGYSFPRELHRLVQYYDFEYTNAWNLDQSYSSQYDIWAVNVDFLAEPKGYKHQGFVTPGCEIEYNPDLKYLNLEINYSIPYHDRQFIHVWYLDPEYSNSTDLIWVAKARTSPLASGEKSMGYVTPEFPDHLDVVFISYNEPNAEENWIKVRQKAPWAKRVHGVKGILEAHRAAAELAKTDLFYVVDGDADLEDSWEFSYQPGVFDRDCAYVWYSRNPINGLVYGYGGVKLFPKNTLLAMKQWQTLDLTESMPKLKVIGKISNTTAFNVDEFSTWRSSFRECVKLCYNIKSQPDNPAHRQRYNRWCTVGEDRPFGKFALEAATLAQQFVNDNTDLININDRHWLEKEFDKLYPNIRKD